MTSIDKDHGAAAMPHTVPHPTATLAACILGSSLAFIDGSVVNVALPALGNNLQASPASLSLVISSYLLPLSSLILLGGAVGDRYGRRLLFMAGVVLFLLASLLCAGAASIHWLLAGRVLQGVGAAILMPNSLALLGASFEGEAKGKAIGTWAGVGALASALGPLLGGWLVDSVGWRAIFLLNLPVGLGACYLAWRYVTECRDLTQARALDWTGATLVTAALSCLTWGLTAAAEPQRSLSGYGVALALGVLLMIAFVHVQRRKGEDGLMPLYLMREPAFIGVTLLTFFLYAALGGLILMLPYLLIRIEGFSAIKAGASILPIPVLIGLGSRSAGRLAARIGARLPLGIGAALVAIGLLLYLRIGVEQATYWADIFPATLVIAFGMAVSVAPLTTAVMSTVAIGNVGIASGFNSAVARMGGLLATALLAFVMAQDETRAVFMGGFHVAVMVGAGLALVASGCGLGLLGNGAKKVD